MLTRWILRNVKGHTHNKSHTTSSADHMVLYMITSAPKWLLDTRLFLWHYTKEKTHTVYNSFTKALICTCQVLSTSALLHPSVIQVISRDAMRPTYTYNTPMHRYIHKNTFYQVKLFKYHGAYKRQKDNTIPTLMPLVKSQTQIITPCENTTNASPQVSFFFSSLLRSCSSRKRDKKSIILRKVLKAKPRSKLEKGTAWYSST